MSIVLIHPPVSKPGEPPAGIARLAGALKPHGIKHTLLDANIEGLLYLLKSGRPNGLDDAWTARSFRNLERNIGLIRNPDTYLKIDRYRRVVRDLDRVLKTVSKAVGSEIGLADYREDGLSPLRSSDLNLSSERCEKNIFYPYFSRRIEGLVDEQRPEWIGFSINYLSQAICAFAMIGFVKRRFPDIKVVLGGGLVTSWIRGPLRKDRFSGLVDHMIAGPGEMKLVSLLGVVPEGKRYRPDYEDLPMQDYFSPGDVLPYSASTGCYWNGCKFCPEKTEGEAYIPISPESVISDITGISGDSLPSLVHFLDSAMSPSLMEALATNGPAFPWYGFARVFGHLTDPGFCMSLRKSGCVMLKLGIESGDQGVLDRMGKGLSIGMASRALKAISEAGIATYIYLIFGTPWEDLHSAGKTLEFTADHSEYIDFLNLAVFNMPASSSGFYGLQTRDFYEADLSLYTDFSHPSGWDRRVVKKFLDAEFRRHPAVSRILNHEPPVFTSNHAPFFVMSRKHHYVS